MFFIGGFSSKYEMLDFNQNIVCTNCGWYGGIEVFAEYMYLSLFFIPILKWNRIYYAKSTCCDAVYYISDVLGSKIERGEAVTLTEADLQPYSSGEYDIERCPSCGCELSAEFRFCPHCGKPL